MKSYYCVVQWLLFAAFLLTAATPAFAGTVTGTATGNVYQYHDFTLPNPQNGLRLVLSSSAPTDFYLYTGTNHAAGSLVTGGSSTNKTLHTLLITTATLTNGGSYHVRIRTASGAGASLNYSFTDDMTYARDLTWDTGASPGGTNIVSQPDTAGGDYLFKIVTPASTASGAWRTALAVSGGEADLVAHKSSVATTTKTSAQIGSDGFVLAPGATATQFAAAQTWYLRVKAQPGATWQLYSGDIYVRNLGTIAADTSSSSLPVTVGPEGTYYFRTTADAATPAWRLWLNGANLPLLVARNSAPVTGVATTYQQSETGQMLLVPPYLTATDTYFVGVTAVPGTVFSFNSQKQPIIDLAHGATIANSVTGYGYITYRVEVPPTEVAWQVNLKRTSVAGNPELYLRSGSVPNVRNNSALSEAAAGIDDSITIVPVTGINPTGTWYVTVLGSGGFDYSLVNGAPAVTVIPYLTAPASITNDESTRSGWRYYRVTDPASFLGKLGWQIELDQAHRAGYEIAIRLNVAPGRWTSRSNDSATAVEYSTIHRNSTSGIFQDPNHQADIWYIGIYNPAQALGAFQLTTSEIDPAVKGLSLGTAAITDQDISTWQWFKFVVPSDPDLKGWDLRLKTIAGNPQMVVRRDLLPDTLTTSTGCAAGSLYNCSTWPSLAQWTAGAIPGGGGLDWTGRRYVSGTTNDMNSYLIMGMGSPLESGTYYVGVARQTGSTNTSPMSYTLESRGIGLAGSTYPVRITDLAFSGGVATGTSLAPREVEWYRVNVPAGSASWSLNLAPTVGEAMLALRQGTLPNITASLSLDSVSETRAGTVRHKNGAEYFYKYPITPGSSITSGDYYIAVISEGQTNPASASVIGTGTVNYTLTSIGAMPVDSTLPPTTLTTAAPMVWGSQSLPYGSQKAYRFRVPAGLDSIEVRLNNKTGNPLAAIRRDDIDSGKLPSQMIVSGQYPEAEGGYADSWRNTSTGSIITIGSPVAGDYTITVFADYVNATNSDASYDLEIAAVVPVDLAFDLSTTSSVVVTNQDYQTWRYFRVVIPDDPNLKGWDLRLKTTAGMPYLVVKRDALPNSSTTSSGCGSPSAVYNCATWLSGSQWPAGSGSTIDWTARGNASVGVADKNSYLIMGMGSPLVPGTYFIGVSSLSGTDAMTYTLESRSIGIGGSYPIQVTDLPFNGGVAVGSSLAPREVGWYKVTVPAGASSWSLNLAPEGTGEALLALRQGRLPNIKASSAMTSDNATTFSGTIRRNAGSEYFYKFPAPGGTSITSGDYYIAVISEGQSPANTSTIGSGTVNYTLTSVGSMPIEDKTATPLSSSAPANWPAQSLPARSEKVYRFRVPAGIDSLEIRLLNKTGTPLYAVRRDAAGNGKISLVTGGNQEGGESPTMQNVTSITPATEGDYTITIYAGSTVATFDLEIVGTGAGAISFANGIQTVTAQAADTWRYFLVTVPADATLKGWDLRLKPSTGNPYMVVRRELLPNTLVTSSGGCGQLYQCSSWLSGAQWGTSTRNDWTARSNLSAPNVPDYGKQLVMGMGSPLEPGTYYVGVARYTSSTDTTPLSYTLESRGIGIGNDSGGAPWPIQVTELAFAGGTVAVSGLAPREVGWYRVAVPAEAGSWSLNLAPTLGEAMLAVRHGRLPNIAATNNGTLTSDHATDFRGAVRQHAGRESFYKYATAGQAAISGGEYYVAVISEGQNPPDDNTIGSGPVSYSLTSVGTMPVGDATATPVGALSPVAWPAQSVPLGQQKVYRFRLPAGLSSVEVKLNNKVGNPIMTIRRDDEGAGRIPDVATALLKPHEGGDSTVWRNRVNGDDTGGSSYITIASPAAGDYTVMIAGDSEIVVQSIDPNTGLRTGDLVLTDASFDLEVRAITPEPLPFTPGSSVSGTLGNGQSAYYRFDVPPTVNGNPLLAWLLKSVVTNGATSIRVRPGQVPGDDNTGSVVSSNRTVAIVPPVLAPGTWYVEVKGIGSTAYTLTSDVVTGDPAKYSRSWTMPARIGSFTQPGVSAPFFGDSGVAADGSPLPGDQGIDLELDGWHYYRITVPNNNSGLLRTELSVLNGRPQIYLRAGAVPGIDHFANPADPNQPPALGQPNAYDYSRTPTNALGSLYNNWVPLDGRIATQLTPGEWWVGVRSQIVNSRYRLKLSVGDVHSTGGVRQDTVNYVQDLPQDGGSFTAQTLLADDMRYYRVAVPQSSTTLGSSTPLSWNITLNQTLGDVVVFIRDTLPPGQGSDGNVDYVPNAWWSVADAIAAHTTAASTYFQDWYDDNGIENPNPYAVIDANGATNFTLPPVEPGKVYYLGVYARTGSTFDISSSITAERLALAGVVPFTNGTVAVSLAGGEERIYRVDVPANATVWQHTGSANSNACLSLQQGTVPPLSGAHWAGCAFNSALTRNLDGSPWQPGHSYYMRVRNTSAGILSLGFTMNGQIAQPDPLLNVTVSGSGAGTITSAPVGIACTSGTCSAQFASGSTIQISQTPDIYSTFGGWGEDCSGTGSCSASMTLTRNVSASFVLAPLIKNQESGLTYNLLQDAVNIADTGNTIRTRVTPDALTGGMTLNRPGVSLILKGGFSADFQSNSGFTAVQTPVIIGNGTLTVERIIIK